MTPTQKPRKFEEVAKQQAPVRVAYDAARWREFEADEAERRAVFEARLAESMRRYRGG
jgi:hypothetical protein